MIAIASLFVVLILSLLVTRIATVALTLTGLSNEVARFQARSAFSGVGFTTGESEQIVNHPVRRRILLLLMLLGNAGIVTVTTSLIFTLVSATEEGNLLPQLLLLVGGLSGLLIAANSVWVNRHLSPIIKWALEKWTDLDVRDYANLLQLYGKYGILEVQVQAGGWLVEKTLSQLRLSEEGVLVLGINPKTGDYLAAPRGQTLIHAEDTLILYGNVSALAELNQRRAGYVGDVAHKQAADHLQEEFETQDHLAS